jgi:hypothetical protein
MNSGQQIPCRYAGGVLADQGCENLLLFLVSNLLGLSKRWVAVLQI